MKTTFQSLNIKTWNQQPQCCYSFGCCSSTDSLKAGAFNAMQLQSNLNTR